MIWTRLFQNGEEGRSFHIGSFKFAETPRVGDSVLIHRDGRKLNLSITHVLHIAACPSDDEPGAQIYGDLIADYEEDRRRP